MASNFPEKAKLVQTVILDVDGVLTDGKLICSPEGEMWRNMNAKDGYALQAVIRSGLQLVIMTSGSGHGVLKKLETFGVRLIFEGVRHKQEELLRFAENEQVDLGKALFIGDDIPDYTAMMACGTRCCPADAVPEIKDICDYVSRRNGGEGCVRDILEKVLRYQDKWFRPETRTAKEE